MKAVVIHATGGPEQLTLADLPDPMPGPGEVLLDVAYAGCNWADTQVRMGIYPHAMTYPMVLGFEVDDIAAMKAHLSSCGIPDYREESMGWGEALELRDNDGHRVLIYAFKGAG